YIPYRATGARLLLYVSVARPSCRGAAGGVSHNGCPRIPKGRQSSPRNWPSELHGSVGGSAKLGAIGKSQTGSTGWQARLRISGPESPRRKQQPRRLLDGWYNQST